VRILFVLPYVPTRIRTRPYHLIRELAARHEVSVLAIGSPRDLDDASSLRQLCRRFEVVELRWPEALRNCVQAGLRGESLQAAICRSPRLRNRLYALLAAEPVDVVHVEHLRASHVRAAIPSHLPTVFDSVDCISLLLKRTLRASHSLKQRAIARFEYGPTRRFEARIIRTFDRVAVTAADDRRALARLSPEVDASVIPNGVDLAYFRPTSGERDPATLVFSGKMSYHANATAALFLARHVFPLVRAAHPEARLRILGSGPPPEVQALARDPAISVTGYVDDLREPLGRASIAVCSVSVKVGMQNKILEAMAMGLPVVSTRLGAEGLLARPEHDILIGDSPTELAGQITRLLGDADLRQRFGLAGRRYVETQHRWGASAERFEDLYGEAINRRRASPGRTLSSCVDPGVVERPSPSVRCDVTR
jgi:glycosyltransferase involved in cell wall biosynthesis